MIYSKSICMRAYWTRTIVCKLDPTADQRAEVDTTLRAFADACNHIAEVARSIHSTNKVKVQHATYREVRERFGLSANLAIRAIARVCAALKVPTKAHSKAVNHIISRRIVDTAKDTGRAIALEDLTGIRERTKARKEQRYRQQTSSRRRGRGSQVEEPTKGWRPCRSWSWR
jgi:predicted transposase